jgi:Protein of unknown function (DUF1003)
LAIVTGSSFEIFEVREQNVTIRKVTANDRPYPPSPFWHNPSQNNIEAIAEMEHGALHRRTSTERFSENTVKTVGSIPFLVLNVLLMVLWVMINLSLIPRTTPFDRFPFGILALVVSAESIVLTIFVLYQPKSAHPPSRKTPAPRFATGLVSRTGANGCGSDGA